MNDYDFAPCEAAEVHRRTQRHAARECPVGARHSFVVVSWEGDETIAVPVEVDATYLVDGVVFPGLIGPGEREEAAAVAGFTSGLGCWVSETGDVHQRQPWGGSTRVAKVWGARAWKAEQAALAAEDEALGSCGCREYHMADCPIRY